MSGVVFKQRYKSVNIKSTPTLNRKHLNYIATRKGAIHNPGCAFGLWGRLPGMTVSENINSLATAKKVVTAASRTHTLYRAILSVDGEAAKQHGLYERGAWQALVDKKVGVLAEQMGIERKDFCWAASMHYVKGHPHVHIMYWDDSGKVRQEFVPNERFELIAEKVRAAFGYEIFREDIQQRREEKRGIVSETRLELQGLCREANLAEALNLNNVSFARLDALQKSFVALAADLPKNGSLKYAYLPQWYKEKLHSFTDEIMKITDFQRDAAKYLKLTDEISQLYGNGAEKQQYNREKAQEELYKGMGNTLLDALKGYKRELELSVPSARGDLVAIVRNLVPPLLGGQPTYPELLKLMPKERTPMQELLADEPFKAKLFGLTRELCSDLRVRALADGYVKASAESPELKELGKKEFERSVYKELHRVVQGVVSEKLQEDSGYNAQMAQDTVLSLLLNLIRLSSQRTGQAQSQRDLLRMRTRELSETAKRDRHKQQEQAGNWSMGQ